MSRRRRMRAISLIESALALGVLALAASALVFSVANASALQVEVRTERQAREAADTVLAGLAANADLADLIDGTAEVDLPPWDGQGCDPQAGTPTPISDPADPAEPSVLCVDVPQFEERPLTIDVTPLEGVQPDSAETTAPSGAVVAATVALPGGRSAEVARFARAPWPGYVDRAVGVVRLRLADPAGARPDELHLLAWEPDPATPGLRTPTVVSSAPVSDRGVALLWAGDPDDPHAARCTAAAPCRPALSTEAPYAHTDVDVDGDPVAVTLAPEDVADERADIVLTEGGVVDRVVAVEPAGSIAVTLNNGEGGDPEPGSVCLWAEMPAAGRQVAGPGCNSDPGEVVFSDLAPDPTRPDLRVGLSVQRPVRVAVDRSDGSCPHVALLAGGYTTLTEGTGDEGSMVGATSGDPLDWKPAAVCTSWTWGRPEFRVDGGSAQQTVVVAPDPDDPPSVDADFPELLAWGLPREASGCAFNGTCAALPHTGTPEAAQCAGPNDPCLSLSAD